MATASYVLGLLYRTIVKQTDCTPECKLWCAVLVEAVDDAAKYLSWSDFNPYISSHYKDGYEFITSSRCHEICDTLDIDIDWFKKIAIKSANEMKKYHTKTGYSKLIKSIDKHIESLNKEIKKLKNKPKTKTKIKKLESNIRGLLRKQELTRKKLKG